MDQNYSRPIRITGSGDATDQKILARSTRIAAISITGVTNDVLVNFTDGPGGEILWTMEADNAVGANNLSFGDKPLLFPNGIYADVECQGGNWYINLAVVEPKSSGT